MVRQAIDSTHNYTYLIMIECLTIADVPDRCLVERVLKVEPQHSSEYDQHLYCERKPIRHYNTILLE